MHIYIYIFWYIVISIVCCMHFIAAVLKTDRGGGGWVGGGSYTSDYFELKPSHRETDKQRERAGYQVV